VNELSLVCSIEAGLAIAWHNCSRGGRGLFFGRIVEGNRRPFRSTYLTRRPSVRC
jgi:hypothetical protein